jgi:hypothetical protein
MQERVQDDEKPLAPSQTKDELAIIMLLQDESPII